MELDDGDLEASIFPSPSENLNLKVDEGREDACGEEDVALEIFEKREDEVERGMFDAIPDDVLYYVLFKNMELVDLLRIDFTCKKWYRLISKAIVEFDMVKTAELDLDTRLGQVLSLFAHGVSIPSRNTVVPVKLEEPWAPHPVRSLGNIEELSLLGISDDTILSHLGSLAKLKKLNIAFTKLTSVGIENLSRLSMLTHLQLLHCGYDRTCLSKIQNFKKLPLVELQVTKDIPLGIRMAFKGLPLTVPQHCIPP